MPIPGVGEVGEGPANACKLCIRARLERAKWEMKRGVPERAVRILKKSSGPTVVILN